MVAVPVSEGWREGPHGTGIRFHWTHGGTPEEFLYALQTKVETLVRDASSHYSNFTSANSSNVDDVLDVAQALYVPVPVAIQSIPLESTIDPLAGAAFSNAPPTNTATIVLDPSTDDNADVLEDLWTPIHLAIMAQAEHHLTWMLKFHASYALKLLKELSRRKVNREDMDVTSLVTTVGEDARAILIDEICAEEDDGGSMADALNAKHVACALIPFLKALAKSSHFMTSLSSTSVSGEASLGAAFTGVAPSLQRAGGGQANTASEVRLKLAIKGFMESLHDESLTPTTPTSTARTTVRSTSQPITVVTPASANESFAAATAKTNSPPATSTTSPSLSPANVIVSRHRHQLFVDLDGLYETVCDYGRGFALSRLQERLPVAPIFFVAFDHEAFNASNRNSGGEQRNHHQLAEYATFRVAAQEAVKICFMHQCFPELPSPVASLRATVTMQKTALTARRGSANSENLNAGAGNVALGAPALRSVPSMRQGGSLVVNSPMSSLTSPTAVTLLHFRLLRRLISRTSDVAYFKEYVLCVEKELFPNDAVLLSAAGEGNVDPAVACLVLPVCLPAIYAASVEFAVRPDSMTTQIVLEKLTWVLTRTDDSGRRSSLLNWMLTPCNTDADRFNELWVSDTYHHQAKKFKTRCEMLAFVATLFAHGNHVYGKGNHQSSHAGAMTDGALQRRVSLASFAQPGANVLAPPGGASSPGSPSPTGLSLHAQQVQLWVRIWEDFFLMLASKVSVAMMDSSVLMDQLSGSYSKTTANSDEKHPVEELVASIKAVLKKLREVSGKGGDDEDDDDDELSGPEDVDDENTNERKIQQRFEKAQHGFEEVAKKQPNDVKLRFYGLFKQATVGDININRPWAMDVPGRAKYDAWMSCKGKTATEAKLAYIDQWGLLSASLSVRR